MPFKLYVYFGGAFVTYCDPILVISILPLSSLKPMFDHLLESSHRDDSNKWSNIGFGEEVDIIEITRIGSQYVTNAPNGKMLHFFTFDLFDL